MKKISSLFVLLVLALTLTLTACSADPSVDVSDDGYLVVNGEKTEYKVHTDPVISVVDGYVAVNGVKTEYKVDTDDVIEIIDGYVVVNGAKTEIFVPACNHSWTTVTTAPTCDAEGYDTLTCSLCGKSVIDNATGKLDHTYATTYSFDDSNHWFECSGCNETKDKATHTLDDDGVCTVCGTPLSATPGIIYDTSADGTYAVVLRYEGVASKVKIADEYKGLPVKIIHENAFSNNQIITSVIIPNSVTIIENGAFEWCSSLSLVVIGDNVSSIGDNSFHMCSSLENVVIPDSVITIGRSAFYNCSTLTSLKIGSNVTSIGNYTFGQCDNLVTVIIPDSVVRIEQSAFYENSNLTNVVIGNGVKYLDGGAFYGCYNLKHVTIGNQLTSINANTFNSCTNLNSVVISNSISYIGENVFSSYNITDIYYSGSQEEWEKIHIDSSNYFYLKNSVIHYNYVPEN